ncbi:NUDIX hydrolase [Halosimplex pelagicum]|uniref:NUDIX domain-containing protein n=1 Tax=Halosimplex pelagicum TaxID=869886 RepID=A0A7D5P494_9EURY|nr:NUDIX domain-containing protein [Halosimplex pelagicum]QLH80543.1 NUDIX domain-containing protein [Halosimplex pelagicum]
MTIEERTREEVDRRLARLKEEFGQFPVVEETAENDPEFFESGVEMVEEGWIGDAGAFVTDDDDRALLIRHESEPEKWGTPGGGHEPGERMAETARREVREETGVDVELTGVFRARRKTAVHADDPDRRFQMLTVWFDGDTREAEIDVGDDEIAEARWFAEPPDRVHDFLEARIVTWAERR